MPPTLSSARRWLGNDYLLLAGLALLCFFFELGAPALFNLDEGAFGEATREMLERGDFLTTYLNGELRFDKPILIYWLQAVSVSLFGLSEWALRLPSALAASAWAVSVYLFARPRLGRDAALAAAVMTATALAVTVIGRAATADALFNLFVALSMFDAFRYIESPRPGLRNRAFAWVGLAVLTKGPVAILIPAAASLAFFALSGEWRRWAASVLHPAGLAICLGIAAPWYLLEYLQQGQAFIDGFIMKHNVGRFSATMEGHGGSVLYYLPATLLVVLPYSGLLIATLVQARRSWREPLERWAWCWFGVVFVVFSLSNTQLPHYILYGASPLFVLMAAFRTQLRSRILAYAPALLLLAALLLVPELLGRLGERAADNAYYAALVSRAATSFEPPYRLWVGGAALLVLALALAPRLAPWRGLLAVGLLQALLVAALIIPALSAIQQEPVRDAGRRAREISAPIVMWGINTPSFSVYRGSVTPRRRPEPGEVVYTRVDKLPKLGDYDILYERGGVALAQIGAGTARDSQQTQP